MHLPKLPKQPVNTGWPPIVMWAISWLNCGLAIYFLAIIAAGVLYGLGLLVSDLLYP